MFCRQCGAENQAEAKFCTHCGAKTVESVAVPSPESAPLETAATRPAPLQVPEDRLPGKSWMPMAAMVLGGVIVLAGAYLAWSKFAPAQAGQEFKDCDVCPAMVALPKGEFMMGSAESEAERGSDEGPQHRVQIAYDLAVGKYEVTQGEWRAIMGENPSQSKDDNQPVEQVSWEDAQAFIQKLNERTGNKYGYRLLTEAEWEYAARAGSSTPFSTGATIEPTQASFNGEGSYNGSKTGEARALPAKVGSFAANAWGLYDMHGNVAEWVEDCYNDSYDDTPADGSAMRQGCGQGYRIVRGGNWHDEPKYLRAASRLSFESGYHWDDIGLRVARTR